MKENMNYIRGGCWENEQFLRITFFLCGMVKMAFKSNQLHKLTSLSGLIIHFIVYF